jgi:uncharacterized protein
MIKNTAIFFIITFVLTVILAVAQQSLQISFEQIVIPQFAPALGAWATMLLVSSMKTRFNLDFNAAMLSKFLLALILPLLLFGIGFFLCQQIGVPVQITTDWTSTLPFMLIGMSLGALGEEIGWRGFLQPFLEKSLSIFQATLVVGSLWGLWHIGHYSKGFFFLSGFLVFTIAASVILRIILEGTRFNIWIAVAFHLGINISFFLFYKNSLSDANMIWTNAVIWAVVAVGFGKKLG